MEKVISSMDKFFSGLQDKMDAFKKKAEKCRADGDEEGYESNMRGYKMKEDEFYSNCR